MRAIGMDGTQITRVIGAEAALYGLGGILLGCLIGLPLYNRLYQLVDHPLFWNSVQNTMAVSRDLLRNDPAVRLPCRLCSRQAHPEHAHHSHHQRTIKPAAAQFRSLPLCAYSSGSPYTSRVPSFTG